MCRHIKLMWDYGCWPIWDSSVFGNIDPATLPLSASTRARLEVWSAIPDAKLAEVDYPPDMRWTAEEEESFEVEGRKLWRILRKELGEDFYVTYHNPSTGPVRIPEDDPVA
jgi:hypothetical protein